MSVLMEPDFFGYAKPQQTRFDHRIKRSGRNRLHICLAANNHNDTLDPVGGCFEQLDSFGYVYGLRYQNHQVVNCALTRYPPTETSQIWEDSARSLISTSSLGKPDPIHLDLPACVSPPWL